jgi:formamidopyrimidine-DNA glycosylase
VEGDLTLAPQRFTPFRRQTTVEEWMLSACTRAARQSLAPRVFSHISAARRAFSKSPIVMVEGHQCHRVVHFHRQKLLGLRFAAHSPNGRFAEGAAAIDGKELTRLECVGKNLFYFFGSGADTTVMRVHFGMAGAFGSFAADAAPAPTPTTRLALASLPAGAADAVVALLSAMIVEYGGLNFYAARVAELGEDPLRADADPEAAWAKVSTSKKSVGLLLMDQSVIAGVGNIYRAEILYKAGVHPEVPGLALPRASWEAVWCHSVDLLRRGFETGSILTVDPADVITLGAPWTRRYIYNQASCGRCGGAVMTWAIAARTVYACAGKCQPLGAADAAALTPARRAALAAAAPAKHFVSHCAPDEDQAKESAAAPAAAAAAAPAATLRKAAEAAPAVAAAAPAGGRRRGRIATAAEAAAEKAAAGESRAVEHVALVDAATAALAGAKRPRCSAKAH